LLAFTPRNFFQSGIVKCQQQCFTSAATVVGVFDRYDKKLSIKSAERDRRSSSFDDHKVFQLIDQAADMPCSNSVTFKIDFNFAAAAIASAIVRLELNTILDIP
jgi:hypothetical protein